MTFMVTLDSQPQNVQQDLAIRSNADRSCDNIIAMGTKCLPLPQIAQRCAVICLCVCAKCVNTLRRKPASRRTTTQTVHFRMCQQTAVQQFHTAHFSYISARERCLHFNTNLAYCSRYDSSRLAPYARLRSGAVQSSVFHKPVIPCEIQLRLQIAGRSRPRTSVEPTIAPFDLAGWFWSSSRDGATSMRLGLGIFCMLAQPSFYMYRGRE